MVFPKTPFEVELLGAVVGGKISTVQELLNNDDIDKIKDGRYFDYYLITKALYKPKVAIAKLLIQKGFRVYKGFKFNDTILHYAVELADMDLITILLGNGASQDILTPNDEKRTPLHLAINKNQCSMIELFLAQLDMKTFEDKYFLQYTIQKHTIPVASELIGDGFLLTKETKEHENFKTLDVILSFSSVKNMEPNNYDDTASIYNASICGNLEAIKKYAEAGLPINISLKLNSNSWSCLSDYSGFTLLHFAVKHVKLEVVKYLLSIGADILVQTENGSTPLHIAFESKEIGIWKTWQDFDDNNSIIDLLLEANTKFNSNPISAHELSHFHIACSRDDPKIVEHFLKLGASINQAVNTECHLYKKFSPLHFAAKFRCRQTVELLLKNKADVNQKDFNEMTALHIAAEESCLEVVSSLVQYGAVIDSVDSYGNTPVHWAFENKSYKMLDVLLSAPNMANSNPTNHDGLSHFHIACTRNNVDVVEKFIENDVLLDACIPAQPTNKKSSDSDSYSDSDSEEDSDSYVSNLSGSSPLHLAICHNKPDVVQLLLDRGAKVEVKNQKGCDPPQMACQYPCEVFTEFIENVLNDQSKYGKITQLINPLTDVAQVDEKFVNYSGSIDKIDWSSNRSEYLSIINSLFRNETDVNRIGDDGSTAIFWAYSFMNDPLQEMQGTLKNDLGCSEALSAQIVESLSKELRERRRLIIDHLLKLNANLDQCSKHGSILHSIAFSPDTDSGEMTELFIKRGANVNARNDDMRTPLHCAVSCEKKNLVLILLDHNVEMNCADSIDKSTPLLVASKVPSESNVEIIELLADRGANVNARRSDGRTALHDLVSTCTDVTSEARFIGERVFKFEAVVSAISALLKAGANINSRDSNGHTPLHVACRSYNYRFARMLLDYGADVNVEDSHGKSVCCYVYDFCDSGALYHFEELVTQVVNVLRIFVVKMTQIGLPISEKTMRSVANCARKTYSSWKRLTEQEEEELIKMCRADVNVLRDTKIHDKCTLHDAMFKNENTLSHLAKNPAFEAVLKSESFEKKYRNYGWLIALKYQEGVKRGELLPKAKWVLNSLTGLQLPDTCSENICKYFRNFELKESIDMLRVALDLKM